MIDSLHPGFLPSALFDLSRAAEIRPVQIVAHKAGMIPAILPGEAGRPLTASVGVLPILQSIGFVVLQFLKNIRDNFPVTQVFRPQNRSPRQIKHGCGDHIPDVSHPEKIRVRHIHTQKRIFHFHCFLLPDFLSSLSFIFNVKPTGFLQNSLFLKLCQSRECKNGNFVKTYKIPTDFSAVLPESV